MTTRMNLLDQDHAALKIWLHEHEELPFRATQILSWIYHHGKTDFSSMSNLGKPLRALLTEHAGISLPKIIDTQHSADGTRKWSLRIDQKHAIETVFIPEDDRGTLCISSQAGCPLDCSFCSTAKQGFGRNLTTGEIIGQVLIANRELGHYHHRRRVITNIVFMGMGEPLLNYDNVLRATRILTEETGLGLARRRITISTAGIIPGINNLAHDTKVSLAISLHAVEDDLRDRLVPINRYYKINDLLAACKRYMMVRKDSSITIEYIMLRDVNDHPDHAKKLVKLLRHLPVKVNLIPFNPFPDCHYRCSTLEAINRFRAILIGAGLVTITRKTRGKDIDAACGQLTGRIIPRAAKAKNIAMGARL